MIRLENISKTYGNLKALDSISLEIGKGELVVLLGQSGSGKSTLLKTINRLVEFESGNIYIDGKSIMDSDPVMLRRSIGYAIQSTGLFPHFTVRENIASVPSLLGWDEKRIDERVRELISLAGIREDYLDKKPRQLSGGEAQRVGVLRALAADPEILLLDEPFGAVDPIIRERLQKEFSKIQKQLGKTVIFVTHDVNEAILLADRVAIMDKGRLVEYATPFELMFSENEYVKEFVGTSYAVDYLAKVEAVNHFEDAASGQSLKDRLSLALLRGEDLGIFRRIVESLKVIGNA